MKKYSAMAILRLGLSIVLVGIIICILVILLRPSLGAQLFGIQAGKEKNVVMESDDRTTAPVKQTRSATEVPTGISEEHMTVGGEKRTYAAYVPASVAEDASIDVLIVLHGTGGSGAGMRDVGFEPYADKSGFVVIYPDALEQEGTPKWDPTNRTIKDVDFIQAIIDEMGILSGGQVGNVYVTGMSSGSVMTQATACSIATIDGVAPVAAGMGEEMQAYCTIPEPLPYIGFYGTVDRFDELEKYESSLAFFAEANGCANNFTTTALPNVATDDGTTVELREYEDKSGALCPTPIHYYRIEGGGHFWPGITSYRADRVREGAGFITSDINATELIVQFFGLDN